jgi:hypothetical protein
MGVTITTLQLHLENGQIPRKIPQISKNLVLFSSEYETLETTKTPWSLSHSQGETHETLSV